MYSPNGFKDRVAEARAAARFGAILTRDKVGRARVVLVPGHNMAQYRVIIRWHKDEETGKYRVSTECHKVAGAAGHIPCYGNTVRGCYHSMAAIIIAAEDAGMSVMFSDESANAKRIKNLGDGTFAMYSWKNGKVKPLFFTLKETGDGKA